MSAATLKSVGPASLAAIVSISLAFVSCGGESAAPQPEPRDRLVIAFDGSPTHLDPRVGSDQNSGRVFDMIYSGLVRFSPAGRYDPDLAESWEMPDERTIVFRLREGVTFHDGSPVTSGDVAFTFESLMAPDFPGSKRAGYADVEAIETPDDRTIIFRLRAPNAGFMDNLTLGIVPTGADPDVFRTSPVGAGPYRVVEFRADEKVELEAHRGHHLGSPRIRHVTIRVIPDSTTRFLELQRGSIDFTLNTVPYDIVKRLESDEDLRIVAEPGAIYQYLAFNLRHKALADSRVRKGIAHAIDREGIVRDLLLDFGSVTETLLPTGHWAHAENLPAISFDPGRSRQLLDEAGFPDPDGAGPATRFELIYKTSTDQEGNTQAEMIQQMLRNVGIGVRIQSNEFGVFYDDITKGNFELFSLRRAGVNDPDFYTYMFHSSSLPPDGQNRGYYLNPRIDELLDRARATLDESARRVMYLEVERILAEDLPYVSLYHRFNVAVMDADLEGFRMYPSGFLLSVPEMHWKDR